MGPSEAAVSAVALAIQTGRSFKVSYLDQAKSVLAAAHDERLGEDQSVRLGDVLARLREAEAVYFVSVEESGEGYLYAADLIEREFGG